MPPDPKKRGLTFWILAWVPAAIAVSTIAIESTKMMGADHTSIWMRPIWTRFFGPVNDDMWDSLHWRIRKTGHFIGYGSVSLLFFASWYQTLRAKLAATRAGYWRRAAALAMLATIVIAASDEIHQTFLPNRGGALHDVLLDTIGGISAQLVLAALYFARRDRSA